MSRLLPQCLMHLMYLTSLFLEEQYPDGPIFQLGAGMHRAALCPWSHGRQRQNRIGKSWAWPYTHCVTRGSSFPVNTALCAQLSCLFQRLFHFFDFPPLAFELSTEWLVLSKIWDVWSYCFSEIKTCSHFLPVLSKWLNMNFFILRIKGYTKNIVNRTWK